MKFKNNFFSLLLLCCITASNADTNLCAVLGVHEPGTNTYDGPTWCKKITVSNLIVRGPLSITHSKVTGLAEVSGPVSAKQSNFQNIQIDQNYSVNHINLKNHTCVRGNITFIGKKGILDIDSTSRVQGQIINAVVHK